jgi:hypothetical protein
LLDISLVRRRLPLKELAAAVDREKASQIRAGWASKSDGYFARSLKDPGVIGVGLVAFLRIKGASFTARALAATMGREHKRRKTIKGRHHEWKEVSRTWRSKRGRDSLGEEKSDQQPRQRKRLALQNSQPAQAGTRNALVSHWLASKALTRAIWYRSNLL